MESRIQCLWLPPFSYFAQNTNRPFLTFTALFDVTQPTNTPPAYIVFIHHQLISSSLITDTYRLEGVQKLSEVHSPSARHTLIEVTNRFHSPHARPILTVLTHRLHLPPAHATRIAPTHRLPSPSRLKRNTAKYRLRSAIHTTLIAAIQLSHSPLAHATLTAIHRSHSPPAHHRHTSSSLTTRTHQAQHCYISFSLTTRPRPRPHLRHPHHCHIPSSLTTCTPRLH